jgi:hypothetical protein
MPRGGVSGETEKEFHGVGTAAVPQGIAGQCNCVKRAAIFMRACLPGSTHQWTLIVVELVKSAYP